MAFSILGSTRFLFEKHSKSYRWYGEASTAEENPVMAKELGRVLSLAQKQAAAVRGS